MGSVDAVKLQFGDEIKIGTARLIYKRLMTGIKVVLRLAVVLWLLRIIWGMARLMLNELE